MIICRSLHFLLNSYKNKKRLIRGKLRGYLYFPNDSSIGVLNLVPLWRCKNNYLYSKFWSCISRGDKGIIHSSAQNKSHLERVVTFIEINLCFISLD